LIGGHRELIQRYGGEFSVISAHVHFADGEKLDPRYQYITFIRDPINRVVSWLFFILTNHVKSDLPELYEWTRNFVESDGEDLDVRLIPHISNMYVEHFRCIEGCNENSCEDKCSNALSAIKKYDVVGLYDQMPVFLSEVAGLIGIPAPREISRINVTSQRPRVEQVPQGLYERIIELNQLDLQLYEEVKAWKATCEQTSSLCEERNALPGWVKCEPVGDRILVTPDLIMDQVTLREGSDIVHGQLMTFDVDFFLARQVAELEMGIHIFDGDKRWAFGINSTLLKQSHQYLSRGSYRVSHHLLADLPEGKYTAGFAFAERLSDENRELAWYDKLCEFQVYHQADRSSVGYACLPAEMTLAPTALAAENLVIKQVQGSITPCVAVMAMPADEKVTLDVVVANQGNQVWKGDVFRPVRLSYHWLDANGEMAVFDGERSPLPEGGIPAGQTIVTNMTVVAPSSPGNYSLVLTLVQEGVSWFEEIGFETASCAIVVKEQL
jgi:hypothetical protein